MTERLKTLEEKAIQNLRAIARGLTDCADLIESGGWVNRSDNLEASLSLLMDVIEAPEWKGGIEQFNRPPDAVSIHLCGSQEWKRNE